MTGAPRLTVRLAQESDLAAWQAFVDAAPEAGCMHHAGWLGVLREAFSVTPCFLLATDGGGIIHGVLPMYRSRSVLAGRHLSSLEGGVLACDPEATRLL